jgi:RNA polymerase sigma-70 factor (ECF subfamily)
MTHSPTDAEIMAACVDDPRPFGAIFDRHAAPIHVYLVRRLGPDHAEAVLGETFRIAFERRRAYRLDRVDARPWLYGIAANLVLQHLRREGRQLATAIRLGERTRPTTAWESDVDDRLDAEQRWPSLQAALDALEPRDREVVILYAWEELSYAEIADALDIPVGTVRSRLSRARRLIRDQVSEGTPTWPSR